LDSIGLKSKAKTEEFIERSKKLEDEIDRCLAAKNTPHINIPDIKISDDKKPDKISFLKNKSDRALRSAKKTKKARSAKKFNKK
jgi:hypothetical protein